MNESVFLQSEYVVVQCGKEGCRQWFAMSRVFYDQTKRTGEAWHCPSGHVRVWKGPTTEAKLAAAEARQAHLEDQLRATEAAAEQVRARLLRDRHRFANGVCPCCNRSFGNVARHMKTQHPGYDPADLTVPHVRYRCSCGRSFGSPQGLRVHQSRSRRDDWQSPSSGRWGRHLTEV